MSLNQCQWPNFAPHTNIIGQYTPHINNIIGQYSPLTPMLLATSWSTAVLTRPMCDAATYVDIGDMAVPANGGRGEELFSEGGGCSSNTDNYPAVSVSMLRK